MCENDYRLQFFLIQSFWVVFWFFCSNIFPEHLLGGHKRWGLLRVTAGVYTENRIHLHPVSVCIHSLPRTKLLCHSMLLNVKHTLGRTANWAWQVLLSVPQSHWLGAWWKPSSALLEYDLLQSSLSTTDSRSAFRRGVKERASSDKGNMQCLFSTFLKLFDEFIPYKQHRRLG